MPTAYTSFSPNTIDPCLKNCAETAATAASVGCSSIFDTACVCGKKDAFVAAATPCVLSGCADKAAQAISMVQTLCTEGIKGGEQSSAAPEPTSEEPKPEPSSSEAPAPTSDAQQSSDAPAPTSSAEETKPSAGGEGESIEGLSPCASKCMVEGAAKQGCKGQDDNACLCTDAFKTAVTPCVAACGADDVTAALALSAKRCAAGSGSETKPSASASASASGGAKPTAGGDKEPECDPRGGSGACAKKYTEPATLTKEDKAAETSQAAAAGAEADAAKQGSGAKALTTGAALTIAGVIAAALF